MVTIAYVRSPEVFLEIPLVIAGARCYRMDALPDAQLTLLKQRKQNICYCQCLLKLLLIYIALPVRNNNTHSTLYLNKKLS